MSEINRQHRINDLFYLSKEYREVKQKNDAIEFDKICTKFFKYFNK